MGTNVTFNGSSYTIPAQGDTGYAQGSGNLSSFLVAIPGGCLQTTGGTFSLSADVNFGTGFGLFAKYFTTVTASPATAGVIRLAIGDTIDWGAGNLALSVSGTNLLWNGSIIATVGNIVERREVYIAGTALNNYTGSLTLINLVNTYVANGANLTLSINGLVQDVSYDYTETSTSSVTLANAANVGDRISLRWAVY